MPRFFVPSSQCKEQTILLAGREAHHALHVLRLRAGDRVTVLNGGGGEFLCELQNFDRDKVSLKVLEKREIVPPDCRITLLQALPRGKLMDSIVQKATELGTFRIVPLLTERVVQRFTKEEGSQKAEKWLSIAVESIKQCGSPWLPKVEDPLTPQEFLSRKERFDLPLLASLQNDATHPRKYFQPFRIKQGKPPASICVWVGPEGDFTLEETEAIKAGGALPITLGPHVLRTETAAIYCLSILNYELQAGSE